MRPGSKSSPNFIALSSPLPEIKPFNRHLSPCNFSIAFTDLGTIRGSYQLSIDSRAHPSRNSWQIAEGPHPPLPPPSLSPLPAGWISSPAVYARARHFQRRAKKGRGKRRKKNERGRQNGRGVNCRTDRGWRVNTASTREPRCAEKKIAKSREGREREGKREEGEGWCKRTW